MRRTGKEEMMSVSLEVDSKARMVNGLGIVLIVVGWIWVGFALVIEVWYLVDLIQRDVPILSEMQALATIELVWVGFLALVGFGYCMRLFAAYARERARL